MHMHGCSIIGASVHSPSAFSFFPMLDLRFSKQSAEYPCRSLVLSLKEAMSLVPTVREERAAVC